jgi:hypothetical protein
VLHYVNPDKRSYRQKGFLIDASSLYRSPTHGRSAQEASICESAMESEDLNTESVGIKIPTYPSRGLISKNLRMGVMRGLKHPHPSETIRRFRG